MIQCNIFTLKLQNAQDRVVPIKKCLRWHVSKMQQIASTAVLCTHCHCTDQDFGCPEGKQILHWQAQLPQGTGMHTTLSNKTRKQSTTPPKPSTINPCLFSLTCVASFHKHWSTIALALCTSP